MTTQGRFMKAACTAGLIEGILVAIGTTANFMLSGGKNPANLLRFVSSGIFGGAAFNDGSGMAILGFIIHMVVAVAWALVFFKLDPIVKTYSKQWIINGIVYGTIVWAVMALIVMPASKAPAVELSVTGALIDVVILILTAGLPISYLATKHQLRVE